MFPAVILEEVKHVISKPVQTRAFYLWITACLKKGKSLISQLGQTGFYSHGRQPALWRLHDLLNLQPEGAMLLWVTDSCVMRPPTRNLEGNTIKIKILSRELENPGWTVIPVRR